MIEFTKECPTCGGTGYEPIPDEPEFDVDVECPSCVGGWLPDDETVEAAARAIFYDLEHNEGTMPPAPYEQARAVLVAAARYQSEGKP